MEDFMQKLITSATMLLTGFVVVFSVLLLLIIIIYIYGKIVTSAEGAAKRKKVKNQTQRTEVSAPVKATSFVKSAAPGEIPGEIVAVIAAAVDSMYTSSGSKVKIKSISKASNTRSPWANAGILDNTRPF